MAQTTTAQYTTVIHSSARNELDSVPIDVAESLKTIAKEAATLKQPSNHSCIKLMRNCNGMMRIRYGDFRALADLDPPAFRILLVDHRGTVYSKTAEARERQSD